VASRLNSQGVAQDRSSAVRRGSQSYCLGAKLDGAVVSVGGSVVESDVNGHEAKECEVQTRISKRWADQLLWRRRISGRAMVCEKPPARGR
jgi:hypothetical protein